MIETSRVVDHYSRPDLILLLRNALMAADLPEAHLDPKDLAPLDQFHSLGLAQTVDLAARLEIQPDALVLDVGSGLGGPSRYLAKNYGCRVTGIDLSESYIEAARYLAQLTDLSEQVDYVQGNALALPFHDDSYDLVWTQHVAMNISDRATLYEEIHRVLRPGGRLAIFDVVAGTEGALHFPVPWARDPSSSFLISPNGLRTFLDRLGILTRSWTDRTAEGVAWFDAMSNRFAAGPPALGLHLILGADFPALAANLGRNLREGRAGLLEVVAEMP
jgi:SAM-dependent methyltransferase